MDEKYSGERDIGKVDIKALKPRCILCGNRDPDEFAAVKLVGKEEGDAQLWTSKDESWFIGITIKCKKCGHQYDHALYSGPYVG